MIIYEIFSQNYVYLSGSIRMRVDNNVVINLKDCNFINNSSGVHLINNGTFKFFGSSNNYIGGSYSMPFYNLRIAKNTGNYVYLTTNIQVNNELYMESGDLDLRDKIITLGQNAVILNEAYNRRIKATNGTNDGEGTGYITTTRTINAGSNINIANMGLIISTSGNLGSTEIRRGHLKQQGSGSYSGNYSIFRYFYIKPTSMQNLTINNFYYFGGTSNPELNGHNENNLQMFQKVNYGGPTYWQPRSTTAYPSSDYISSSTVNPGALDYILITLGSTDKPLPVELISFNCFCKSKSIIELEWITASEYNNDGFYIQVSNDLENWENIAFIKGELYSHQPKTYTYVLPYIEPSYFRLKQEDIDGSVFYSNAIYIDCNSIDNEKIVDIIPIYPNAFEINFIVKGEENCNYTILLTDILGRKIKEKNIKLLNNKQVLNFSQNIFSPGIYHVWLISDENVIVKELIIE